MSDALRAAPGVALPERGIVTPRDVEDTDQVHVARLRPEAGDTTGRHFQLWAVGDQLRKGAATNAVQILELLIAQGRFDEARRASEVVVPKFGGSSLSTAELREIAASRVIDVGGAGSAGGGLLGARPRARSVRDGHAGRAARPGPQRAQSRSALGLRRDDFLRGVRRAAPSWALTAQAMTGLQAGITTDECLGDAEITEIDPAPCAADREQIIPVIAGFQGVHANSRDDDARSRRQRSVRNCAGRRARCEAVEIYTDVSGVMSGDPRRIAGAHTVDRVD